ncbi:MAG: hypothetical protein AAGL49_11120 [Pseudomonadota bacterium]
MTVADLRQDASERAQTDLTLTPVLARTAIMASAAAGLAAGGLMGGEGSVRMEADLARLLQAMAAIKALLLAPLLAAILWRLGSPSRLRWIGAYGLLAGLSTAGVAMVWTLAHVGLGAALLHGGLLGGVLLLWRDPGVKARLDRTIARRRAKAAARREL